MMMNLMTILVKKVFISSKPTFVYLLCPPLCGPFSIQESAAGGLSYKAKKDIHRMSLFCIIESTRRRRTSGGRSTATTAAERRLSNRSSPAGLEHTKKEVSNGYLLFCIIESTRRDSNPRPSPWQGDTPPLSHSCTHTFKTTY